MPSSVLTTGNKDQQDTLQLQNNPPISENSPLGEVLPLCEVIPLDQAHPSSTARDSRNMGLDSGGQTPGVVTTKAGACYTAINQRKRDTFDLQDLKTLGRPELGQYHPDGGWGWVILAAATLVHTLCGGFHLAYGSLYPAITNKFQLSDLTTAWLGSLGYAISLFIAPVVTTICRRKSPRLYGVIGGLATALGCLFLGFSNKLEELFISHCLVMSVGSGVTMATANIMVGRYFRQRRDMAEMVLVAGTGAGAAIMATIFQETIRVLQWMNGLQCVAGLLVMTIVAGAMYRSASLYHPRRKVILHLKSQKKNRRDREAEKPPYLDFTALKMRSLKALIAISAVIGLGIHVPFILLVKTAGQNNEEPSRLFLLNVYLGLGFVLGCVGLGFITIRNSNECHISRRHLCQTSAILCGFCTILLIMANNESSHALYAWAYGICCGSYYYSLKIYLFELVKTKLMERAWSFLCAASSFPILFGAPVASYLNMAYDSNAPGYIFAGVVMIVGGLLFYTMPFFERHPSNDDVLEKNNSNDLYPPHLTEAAALLDMDLMEGCGSEGKHPQTPPNVSNGVLPGSNSSSSITGKGDNPSMVRVQLQCLVQHKDSEKLSNQTTTLTKIVEESLKDVGVGKSVSECVDTSRGNHPGYIQVSVTKAEYSDSASECVPNSQMSCGRECRSGGYSKYDGKKSKKTEVRIDLFDPPSQEKESTATVSYDSDLYINLCEAHV